MGNRRISRDVKIAALNLYEQGHLSIKKILACVACSGSTFFCVLRLWRTTGDVVRPQNRTGRPRVLHHDDINYLISLIHHRLNWFLDKLLNLLKHNHFISVHYTTIHRELERTGMSTKKLDKVAEEQSEPSRLDYILEISQIPADCFAFLDETSKNDETPGRRLGRAKKVVEGSMHCDQFLGFLEHQVASFPF
ncbi:hypothetical protein DFH08DRAFT_621874, partial [Mycena albidolilacea]